MKFSKAKMCEWLIANGHSIAPYEADMDKIDGKDAILNKWKEMVEWVEEYYVHTEDGDMPVLKEWCM